MSPPTLLVKLADRLHIRRSEYRAFTLACVGAFLVLSYLVAARALREALYLSRFAIETLPYIVVATTVIGLPAVGLFTRLLARQAPGRVYRNLALLVALGVAVLGGLAVAAAPGTPRSIAIVLFYPWAAIGAMLLSSGFWVLTADAFALRDAKRLFGLIGAGGTVGAMVTGASISWITAWVGLPGLVGLLLALLAASYVLQTAARDITESDPAVPGAEAPRASLSDGLAAVLGDRHLRTIAAIVGTATVASTLLDFQFKEIARATFTSGESLAAFLGNFYGVTGVIALLLQMFVAGRLLRRGGVAGSLAVLPLVLILGSAAVVAFPGLAVATLIRGADNSLRRSLHRSVIEYLYVPVPSVLRRKTKAFVDSAVDSAAEGTGAAIIYVLVTLAGLPSSTLSIGVAISALAFMCFARVMGSQYVATLSNRLQEHDADPTDTASRDPVLDTAFGHTELLTFTQLDLSHLLPAAATPVADEDQVSVPSAAARRVGLSSPTRASGASDSGRSVTSSSVADIRTTRVRLGPNAPTTVSEAASTDLSALLRSADPQTLRYALQLPQGRHESHVPLLLSMLARDELYGAAGRRLAALGAAALPTLRDALASTTTDFVIHRRLPAIVAHIRTPDALEVLIDALSADRFEVRYRAGLGLARERRNDLAGLHSSEAGEHIWEAVRRELGRERPVWELQRLLDEVDDADEFVAERLGRRGELSLQHTFRLLSLMLDTEPVLTAYRSILSGNDEIGSIALEYLEQVLPKDIGTLIWPHIDAAPEVHKTPRPIDDVVEDLLQTGATLFVDIAEHERLRAAIRATLPSREAPETSRKKDPKP